MFCGKCGSKVLDDAQFCNKCGSKIVPFMPMDESIRLAEMLSEKYGKWDMFKQGIIDNEAVIKRTKPTGNAPRYTRFRFFWPFLIWATVLCIVVRLIGIGVAYATQNEVYRVAFIYAAYIFAVLILIGGFVNAKGRADDMNNELKDLESVNERKYKSALAKTEDLRKKLERVYNEIKEYDAIVPPPLRNRKSMYQVKEMLLSGKARDFYDAIEQCSSKAKPLSPIK